MNTKKYNIILIFLLTHSHGFASNQQANEFFKRESQTIELSTRGLMSVCTSKKRHGPPGPEGLIEVSPWVKSVSLFEKIALNERCDFVFDCVHRSLYARCPTVYGGEKYKSIGGHVIIAWEAKISNGCGGEIWKISENPLIFRSNESSGHRGIFWTDQRRFSYLNALHSLGITVCHEPFTLDENKADIREIVDNFIPYDYQQIKDIHKMQIFQKLSLDDLRIFQRNFYRHFGNSVFNFGFYASIYPAKTRAIQVGENSIYERQDDGSLRLKNEFIGKGCLDKEFNFVDPSVVQNLLLEQFHQTYRLALSLYSTNDQKILQITKQ